MAYPVTLNGRTYTLADFEGTNYVEGLPDAFEDFVTHAGDIYNSTSTTSNTIGTGSKTFTVESAKPYQAGTPLRIADASAPSTNFIDAIVTSYSGTTLVVDSVGYAGSGTFTSWNVNIGGSASVAGTVAIAQGGTGATTAAAARTNLDVYSKADADSRFLNVSGEASDVTMTGNVTIGDAAGDTLSVPATASFSGGSSFSGGISGDVAFDTDTLYVDSTNDRVGINVASPDYALDVIGTFAQQEGNVRNTIASSSTGFEFTANANALNVGRSFTFSSSQSGGSVNEHMRINSLGRVLIGHDSAVSNDVALQVTGSNFNQSGISVARYSNNSSSTHLYGVKSRSSTVGTPGTIVQNNDNVLIVRGYADDGVDDVTGVADIGFAIDGTPGADDMPGRIVFSTTADGASSSSERMRIQNDGNIGVGTTSPTEKMSINGNISLDSSTGSNSGIRNIEFRNTNSTGYDVALIQGRTGTNIYEGQISFQTKDSGGSMLEAMRIDSSQRVLIGLTSDIGTGHKLQVNNDMTIMTFDGTTTGANGVRFIKSRATSPGSNAIVANGDDVGFLDFRADDGTDYATRTAVIASSVDGTPGVNDMPGRLEFYTTPDGGSSVVERMRINSSGDVLVGKTVQGLASSGFEITQSGQASATQSGASCIRLNRLSSFGELIQMRKDTSQYGIIGLNTNGYPFIANPLSGGGGVAAGAGSALIPTDNTGTHSDNTKDVGASSVRFDDVYATNGTIQTSDQNEKQQIASLTDAEITAAKAISQLFKTFKWNDSVAEKGDAARTHSGVIAQDVEQAMSDAGLNAGDYAFFISTTWWEADETFTDDEGVEQTRTSQYDSQDDAPEGATERNRKGIRYPELLSFIGAATEQRLASIEARLDALET